MRLTKECKGAKSIHILAWPFKFKSEGEKTREAFQRLKRCVENSECWQELSGKNECYVGMENTERFMLYQYLSDSARDVFLNKNLDICKTYEYKKEFRKDWKYYINKADKEYELPIDGIELHLYHFGLGILFLHLYNDQYKRIEDIKIINDQSRRTKIPFIPENADGLLCPKKLGIRKGKENLAVTEFDVLLNRFYEASKNENASQEEKAAALYELTKEADFFRKVLEGRVENGNVPDYNTMSIETFSEDRLFSMIMLRDSVLSGRIAKMGQPDEEKWKEYLYSVFYLDPADASCQSQVMREKLFENSLYRRWENYGTLSCIHEYAMVTITTDYEGIDESVVRPFVVEYTYFISLMLAQRMGITLFSDRAGKIAEKIEKSGHVKRKVAEEIVQLQAEYVTFKNQVLILEASSQQQGIELYQKMQSQLLVENERGILDEQLESLYEISNMSAEKRVSEFGIWLAIAAIVVDVVLNIILSVHFS